MESKFCYTILLLAAMTPLASCDSDSVRQPKAQTPSLSHTTVYDPSVNTTPGDPRPTAPGPEEVTPQEQNGNGNSGIIIPGTVIPAPARR